MKILRRAFDRIVAGRGGDTVAAERCVTADCGDGWIEIDTKSQWYPRGSGTAKPVAFKFVAKPSGPGSELHALLRDWLGIEPTADCPCRSMAGKMDRLGPDWCESDEGMAEILGVMRTEHGRRWADGRTILPWTDMGARQLVLLACRRARAKVDG